MASPLSTRFHGPVFAPGDPGYAEEVASFNRAILHAPDLVVGAADEADVVAAVQHAREAGCLLSVQGAGHGAYFRVTSGVLLSTRRLDGVRIDPEARTAIVGAGVRWRAVIAAAAPFGLAPVAGSSPTVGVVGYLLGGGLGPLARSHGFSSDYLLSAKVVTGTGEVLTASADENRDLLWALRGGKVGLGVVTEVLIRLAEIPALYAGALFFAEEHIETSLRAWTAWTATAPPRVSTSVAIIRFPPFEAVPAPLRGRRLLSLRFSYPGAADEGARLAEPLRAAAPVHLDTLGPMPLAEVARIHNDPTEPSTLFGYGRMLSGIDQGFASLVLERFGAGTDSPFSVVEVRHLGEATRHDVPEGSAAAGREAGFTFACISLRPELFERAVPAEADHLTARLAPWLHAETNVNFAGTPRSADHYTNAWSPETKAKLAEIRRRYDPEGVFAARE